MKALLTATYSQMTGLPIQGGLCGGWLKEIDLSKPVILAARWGQEACACGGGVRGIPLFTWNDRSVLRC